MIRKNSVDRVKLEAKIYKLLENSQQSQILKTVNARFSDCVIRFYGSFKTNTHLFIVNDYCQRGDLSKFLNEYGGFSEEWSKQIIAEIIVGISMLHACGIIYNDLKPENILMTNNGHIKFTDFGIS